MFTSKTAIAVATLIMVGCGGGDATPEEIAEAEAALSDEEKARVAAFIKARCDAVGYSAEAQSHKAAPTTADKGIDCADGAQNEENR